MKRLLTTTVAAGALGTLLVLGSPVAHAGLVFQIGADGNFSGSGNPTGPFGTVTLVDGTGTGAGQNGIALGTVQVDLKLAPNVFAMTGASDSFEFSLNGNPTITTTNITNLMFTGVSAPSTSSYALDTSPTKPNGAVSALGLGINCTACGNGTSPPQYNELKFDITDSAGLHATNFVAGDTAGYYFLADIGISGGSPTGYSGATGPGTNCTDCGVTTTTSVPEPASMLLLGASLTGLGVARRWRR